MHRERQKSRRRTITVGNVDELSTRETRMLRMLALLLLIGLLAVSIGAILSNSDPQRLKAAGWGMLSGSLIVGGLWMIFAGG